jgi:hypothetical protein
VNPVQTVITAAGDSRTLFLGAGFSTPKSLVERSGKTMLVRAIESYVVDLERAVVAINSDEQDHWPISQSIQEHYPNLVIEEISSSVKGALVTALMALRNLDLGLPLVVAAGDSEIVGGITHEIEQLQLLGYAAGTIVFPSDNPRLSYIAIDAHDQVIQIAEKHAIGPQATTGVFYFSTAALFLEAAEWCLVNSASHGGLYFVSTALNFVLQRGLPVGYITIPPSRYIPGGLPVDYVRDVQ